MVQCENFLIVSKVQSQNSSNTVGNQLPLSIVYQYTKKIKRELAVHLSSKSQTCYQSNVKNVAKITMKEGKDQIRVTHFKNLKGVSVYQRLLMRQPAQKLGART